MLSDKRRMAQMVRWEKERKGGPSERRFLADTSSNWKKCHSEVESMLPADVKLELRMNLFARLVKECGSEKVSCDTKFTPARDGKSNF